MAIVVKEIKPTKLREDALRLELLNEMRAVGRDIAKDFAKTVETWEGEKPKFEMLISLVQPGPTVVVEPTGSEEAVKKYAYVTKGTKKHRIKAKKGKSLAFAWAGPGSYKAKTKPRVIGSTPGGATGEAVFPKAVMHPGTEAREFDEEIQKIWQPRFKDRMEGAMRKAAKASGHGKE